MFAFPIDNEAFFKNDTNEPYKVQIIKACFIGRHVYDDSFKKICVMPDTEILIIDSYTKNFYYNEYFKNLELPNSLIRIYIGHSHDISKPIIKLTEDEKLNIFGQIPPNCKIKEFDIEIIGNNSYNLVMYDDLVNKKMFCGYFYHHFDKMPREHLTHLFRSRGGFPRSGEFYDYNYGFYILPFE